MRKDGMAFFLVKIGEKKRVKVAALFWGSDALDLVSPWHRFEGLVVEIRKDAWNGIILWSSAEPIIDAAELVLRYHEANGIPRPMPLKVAGEGGAPPSGLRAEPGPWPILLEKSKQPLPDMDHDGAETAFGLGSFRYPICGYEAFFGSDSDGQRAILEMYSDRKDIPEDNVFQYRGDGGTR